MLKSFNFSFPAFVKHSLFFYRLASVQEHRAPQIPKNLVGGKIPSAEDKRALLENIKAMVPDHQTRLRKLEVWNTLPFKKNFSIGLRVERWGGGTVESSLFVVEINFWGFYGSH